MKSKVLIFGGGFLGERLHRALGWNISRKIIKTFQDAQGQITKYRPRVIINCIGHTGRNVDGEVDNITYVLGFPFDEVIRINRENDFDGREARFHEADRLLRNAVRSAEQKLDRELLPTGTTY